VRLTAAERRSLGPSPAIVSVPAMKKSSARWIFGIAVIVMEMSSTIIR
jgi:hypothetical protein